MYMVKLIINILKNLSPLTDILLLPLLLHLPKSVGAMMRFECRKG